ncbi:MAG: hypothetical protein ACKV0T_24265 [Planctomycetales bacterium]
MTTVTMQEAQDRLQDLIHTLAPGGEVEGIPVISGDTVIDAYPVQRLW